MKSFRSSVSFVFRVVKRASFCLRLAVALFVIALYAFSALPKLVGRREKSRSMRLNIMICMKLHMNIMRM